MKKNKLKVSQAEECCILLDRIKDLKSANRDLRKCNGHLTTKYYNLAFKYDGLISKVKKYHTNLKTKEQALNIIHILSKDE